MLFCSFPTTVLFVDDNPAYLKILLEVLSGVPIMRKSISNLHVTECLVNYKSDVNFSKIEVARNIKGSNEFNIISNIGKLYKVIYDKRRFDTISVVVLDYLMPGKTGREIIEEIKDVEVKKVFLTSFLNSQEAVDLLNAKMVNQCFNKYDRDFIEHAPEYLTSLIRGFFEENVRFRYTHVPFLKNPFMCRLIDNFIQELKPVEYYVLDNNGSYLFLDGDANISALFAYTEDDMDKLKLLLDEYGIGGEKYDAIANKQAVLGAMYTNLGKTAKERLPAEYFANHIVTAKYMTDPNSGRNVYYAYVQDKTAFPIDMSRVVSFNEALRRGLAQSRRMDEE